MEEGTGRVMAQEPLRDPKVTQEFERRRSTQLMATPFLILAIVVLVWAREHPLSRLGGIPASTVSGIAFAVVMAGVLFSFRNWRCPACNRYLGKAWNPNYCARCGVQLR